MACVIGSDIAEVQQFVIKYSQFAFGIRNSLVFFFFLAVTQKLLQYILRCSLTGWISACHWLTKGCSFSSEKLPPSWDCGPVIQCAWCRAACKVFLWEVFVVVVVVVFWQLFVGVSPSPFQRPYFTFLLTVSLKFPHPVEQEHPSELKNMCIELNISLFVHHVDLHWCAHRFIYTKEEKLVWCQISILSRDVWVGGNRGSGCIYVLLSGAPCWLIRPTHLSTWSEGERSR